jgi:hypothetical protein
LTLSLALSESVAELLWANTFSGFLLISKHIALFNLLLMKEKIALVKLWGQIWQYYRFVQLTPAIHFTLRPQEHFMHELFVRCDRYSTELCMMRRHYWRFNVRHIAYRLHACRLRQHLPSGFCCTYVFKMMGSGTSVRGVVDQPGMRLCCEENALPWQPTGIKGGTGLIDILLKTQMGHRQACRHSIKSLCESCRICISIFYPSLSRRTRLQWYWHYHTAKWKCCFGK